MSFALRVHDAPAGTHAVHIHEYADCSAPDAASAGKHWNPTGENHGRRGGISFHLGDIGNVEVGADGSGTLSLMVKDWSLKPASERSVVGKALVVHAGPDDFETQPDGGGGQRIGCGVIETGERESGTR